MVSNIRDGKEGVNIENEDQGNPRFSDDLVILEDMLQNLEDGIKKYGMKLT